MRRKRSSPHTGDTNRIIRRRGNADLAEVPVFQADPRTGPTPRPVETEDQAADEAIRRMVEAAYT